MKRIWFFLLLMQALAAAAQQDQAISENYLSAVVHYLAADSLKGRGNYSPELYQAALFIANEFEKSHLKTLPGFSNYFQPFTTRQPAVQPHSPSAEIDPATTLLNVVGYLPADSATAETIVFSAHYDHLGSEGESIHNGANDNASGVAALFALTRHYAQAKGKKRNLIFCAFAGEELGLKGSAAFTEIINPKKIIANINIEMIGMPAYGPNRFFITGAYYSALGKILRRNLKHHKVKVVAEPEDSKNLFYRSDNYSFVQKGIAAHSIMSSDDDDGCYHAGCDDAQRLNYQHMAEVVKALVQGLSTIVEGKETPQLR